MKYFTFCIAAICVMLAGCGGSTNYRTVSDDELNEFMFTVDGKEKYREYYRQILSGGETDVVINYHGLAMAAMNNMDYQVAAHALDEQIKRIEMIYANNPTAKKARSKFQNEKIKNFKGEPYERAMVFLKRGLLYLYEDDYENARAMFESGLLQDSLADDSEYIHDYASLEYLSGWASQCNGDMDLAQESFDRVLALNSNIKIPNEEDNFLIYIELGLGPEKVGQGEYKEKLTFQERLNYEQRKVKAFEMHGDEDDGIYTAQLMEDIHWQATTRGGREIDMVNEGKAVFKEKSGDVADAMMDVAATASYASLLTDNSDMANLGAAGAVVGLVSMFMSAKTKPAADLRSIHTPGRLYIGTGVAEAAGNSEENKWLGFLVYENGEKIKYYESSENYNLDESALDANIKYFNSPVYHDFDGRNWLRAQANQTVNLESPLAIEILDEHGSSVDTFVYENTEEFFKRYNQFKAINSDEESNQIENCAINF